MPTMSKRGKIVVLLLIIIGGFLLRLAGLYWGEAFHHASSGDEMAAYRVAMEFAAGQERAQYIGQPNFKGAKVPGPLWALFWLAGLKIGGSPASVCLLIIFLGTAVIYLVYRLAEKLLGPEYSLWAALFCATSPWAVHYSVGATNPLPMAFLAGLLYLSLWDVVVGEKSPKIFWVCLILTVMPQFHMMVIFFAPAVLLVLALNVSRVNWRWLVAGVVVSAALYIPYIVGDRRHGWENTRAILGGHLSPSFGVLKILILPVTNLSNLISSITGETLEDYRAFGDACFGSAWVLAAFNVVSLALAAAMVGCFLATFIRILRQHWRSPRAAFATAPAEVFIGLLFFLPLLLFILSFNNFSSRYMIIEFPLLFLLPALFVVRNLAKSRWRKPILATLLVMVVFNVYLTLASFCYQTKLIETGDRFLPSFQKMEEVRQRLKADAGPGNRIQIDQAPLLAEKKRWTAAGAVTLADYIDLRETYDPSGTKAQGVKTYRVLQATDNVATNDRVAYSGNGLVIVTAN
jgi:4-amino-4-deoxy-L-arabinose transferase-like glycosyltransferase